MQIAVLTTAWEAPMTMASTSFIKGIIGGAQDNGDQGLVVIRKPGGDVEAMKSLEQFPYIILGSHEASVPFLIKMQAELFRIRWQTKFNFVDKTDWVHIFLLTSALQKRTNWSTENILMVYPRSYELFRQAVVACTVAGWRIGCFATEQLTDEQVNPSTRDHYVQCVVEHAHVLWSVSESLANYWSEKGVDRSRVFINPSVHRTVPVPPDEIQKKHTAAYVGNIAVLYWGLLMAIAEKASTTIEAFSLCIYCDARPDELAARESELVDRGMSSFVTLRSGLMGTDLYSELYSAEVLLAPRSAHSSHEYGFPHKLGEYLLSGIPTVATAGGDIPRYFTDGELYLARLGDMEDFVAQMCIALESPSDAYERALRGKSKALELLHGSMALKRFGDFLNSLSGE